MFLDVTLCAINIQPDTCPELMLSNLKRDRPQYFEMSHKLQLNSRPTPMYLAECMPFWFLVCRSIQHNFFLYVEKHLLGLVCDN